MVDIVVIPADELPRHLTARHVVQGLGEHLDAFLAANNMSGWKAEDEYILRDDRVADQLLLVSQATGLYVTRLKRIAKSLTRIGRANGADLKISNVQEMLARALGYNGYHIAYHCRTVDDFIENIWPMGAAMSLDTLNRNGECLDANPNLRDRLLERMQFNRQRDHLLRSNDDPVVGKALKRERKVRDKPKGWADIIPRPTNE